MKRYAELNPDDADIIWLVQEQSARTPLAAFWNVVDAHDFADDFEEKSGRRCYVFSVDLY